MKRRWWKCLYKMTAFFYLLNGSCLCRENAWSTCVFSYSSGCKSKDSFDIIDGYCKCKLLGCKFCNENGCDQCIQGYRLENIKCILDSSTVIRQYFNDNKEGGCFQCNANFSIQFGKWFKNPDSNSRTFTECPSEYYASSEYCFKTCSVKHCNQDKCDNKCLISTIMNYFNIAI